MRIIKHSESSESNYKDGEPLAMPGQAASVERDADRSNLPALSIDAAIELDRLMAGGRINMEVIHRFAVGLGNISGMNADAGVRALHADPRTVDVFSRAVDSSAQGIKNVDQLSDRIFSLLENVKHVPADLAKVRELKSFCISLHQVSLAESALPSDANDQILTNELAIL